MRRRKREKIETSMTKIIEIFLIREEEVERRGSRPPAPPSHRSSLIEVVSLSAFLSLSAFFIIVIFVIMVIIVSTILIVIKLSNVHGLHHSHSHK